MIKKQIRNVLFLLLLFMIFTLPARAAEDTVTLTTDENTVEVVLIQTTETAGMEEIVSLQLSFQINVVQGKLKQDEVSFEFDRSVKSEVEQYRYQPETGILSIYISGNGSMIQESSLKGITLGKVILNPSADTAGVYTVGIKENSLKVVNGAFYMEEPSIYAQAEEQIRLGNAQSNPGGNEENENKNESNSGTGSTEENSSHKYFDDWYSDDSSGQVPVGNSSSERAPGIYTTSNNPAPGKENTIPDTVADVNHNPARPSGESQNSEQMESTSVENPSGIPKSSIPDSETNRESVVDSTRLQPGDLENSIAAQPKETGERSENMTDMYTEKNAQVSMQPDEETEHEQRKAHTVVWMLVVLAAVIVSAVAVVVLIRKEPDKHHKGSPRRK